jgi:hypothetical protein
LADRSLAIKTATIKAMMAMLITTIIFRPSVLFTHVCFHEGKQQRALVQIVVNFEVQERCFKGRLNVGFCGMDTLGEGFMCYLIKALPGWFL